jgi:hypothetical protein
MPSGGGIHPIKKGKLQRLFMPRDNATAFGDLVGKLDVPRIS